MQRGDFRRPFLFSGGAQQDDQCAFAAIVRSGLAIGQDFLALGQPAAHKLTQDGELLWRTMALAVDDPHTALAVVQAFREKAGKAVPGFVPIHTVQIEFGLHDPATTP